MQYTITTDEENGRTVTFFSETHGPVDVSDTHPFADRIVEALLRGEDPTDLWDTVNHLPQDLTDQVRVVGNTVLFDGDPLPQALQRQIVRFLREDADEQALRGLVKFIEKVMSNVNPHSRDQLLPWLEHHSFTITENGDFLAYKGVSSDMKSIHGGGAWVNGQWVKGRIPNEVDSLIEMSRGSVTFDPSDGCADGLHAGTQEYAMGYAYGGGFLLRVRVNPRDVVSVPTDCNAQKVRVCRYTVQDVVEVIEPPALFEDTSEDSAYDDDFEDDFV